MLAWIMCRFHPVGIYVKQEALFGFKSRLKGGLCCFLVHPKEAYQKMTETKNSMHSNLESFLNCTTPTTPSRLLPKSGIRNLNKLWHPWEREKVEYFTLEDLWCSYHEWSAYGAGVPIVLDNEDTVVQYYVPYLSAIQIFTSSVSLPNFRSGHDQLKEERTSSHDSDERGDSSSDCWSGESGDAVEKQWRHDVSGWVSGDAGTSAAGELESMCQHFDDRLGFLYFQYFETSTPYGRVPLMDKIYSLAERHPGLMSLKSVDLSPASWMAVAWYPIYHIPSGRTVKDLSARFLTYHTLSSSFHEIEMEEEEEEEDKGGEEGNHSGKKKKKIEGTITLPPFGIATYKMKGSLWVSPDGSGRDQGKLLSLLCAADSWLKQLRVQHHDFNYFSAICHGQS